MTEKNILNIKKIPQFYCKHEQNISLKNQKNQK